MSAPPQQVFVHIGLHKTGTTYLQGALRVNAAELAAQGVHLPSAAGARVFRAVDDLQGRRPRATDDARIHGAWPVLVDAVRGCGLPRAVFSDERLSLSGLPAIRRVRQAFEGSELHVIVTVRDLARVLVSSWEEAVRGGATWTWAEYAAAVRDPERRGVNPARSFWARQDLGRICAAWEVATPQERIHVVTVPPPGGDPRLLLDRFVTCLGVDPARLTGEPGFARESAGPAATEVVRRLNARLGGRLNQRQYEALARALASAPPGSAVRRAVLPAEEAAWVRGLAEQDCAMLRGRGYLVVGELTDLVPVAASGPRPDEVSDGALLEAALSALEKVGEGYGRLAWRQERAQARRAQADGEAGPTAPSARQAFAGGLRAAVFRARRAVLDAGDRGGPLGTVVAAGYRLREARQERAMRAARRARAPR